MKFLILAGGQGSRLWPVSTHEKPKQFQSFIGSRTLLQMAFDRIKNLCKAEDIYISSNACYQDILTQQLPEIPAQNLIFEPIRKDTAPCIAYAMQYIKLQSKPDETVSIIYADHLIQNIEEFHKALITGHKVAKEQSKFIIIEVKAKFPNPNLGYAKIGKQIHDSEQFPIYELDHFTEKPDLETAKQYLQSYKYLWNTGYYIWRIDNFFSQLQKHSPAIAQIATNTKQFPMASQQYQNFPKISLDYALIEKMHPQDIWILPADLSWSDIGTWQSLFQELAESENVTEGAVDVLESQNCLVINKDAKHKISVLNTQNLAIIHTESQTLICDLNSDNLLKKYLNS